METFFATTPVNKDFVAHQNTLSEELAGLGLEVSRAYGYELGIFSINRPRTIDNSKCPPDRLIFGDFMACMTWIHGYKSALEAIHN